MKNQKDLFENQSVLKSVMNLALPSIMGQIILVIYNMADTLFIGMTGSDVMISAVTVCMPAFMFLSAISNLFGIGGSSAMARALGKGDFQRVKNASAFAFWGSLIVSGLYASCSWIFLDRFINLLGGINPQVHKNAAAYLMAAVVLGGVPTALNTLFSHLLRGVGQSLSASIGITVGGILNVVLDPLFMFVLLPKGNEALAAALATAISNFISLGYYAVVLKKNKKTIPISIVPSKESFRKNIVKEVLYTGIPACLMTLCENISYAVLDNLMSSFGTAVQAGIGVAKKLNMLAHCFVRGMSQGVLPLIAYNYASGNRKRMNRTLALTIGISLGISALCTAFCLFFAPSLVEIFIRGAAESSVLGAEFLKILCLGAPFSAFAYTVISFFQATGKGFRSLILALLRKGILDIPLMFLLRKWNQPKGIVYATPYADIFCFFAALLLFVAFQTKEKRLDCKENI